MPAIRIDYDNEKCNKDEIVILANETRKIVAEATKEKEEDVFVYGNSSQIKVNVAPIEVFVEMSAQDIKNVDELFEVIKSNLSKWKNNNAFQHPINFTLLPRTEKFEIDI